MTTLLRRSSVRYLLRHPWQLVLAVFGVALGVAVVVAIDVANGSAQRAFDLSSEAITGKATHRITSATDTLPQEIYRRLRVDAGIRPIAPVIEGSLTVVGAETRVLRVLGIDPFAEAEFRDHLDKRWATGLELGQFLLTPGGVLLAPQTANELGLEPTSQFSAFDGSTKVELDLVGLLDPHAGMPRGSLEDLLIMDLASAQEIFGLQNNLTRIDLIDPTDDDTSEYLNRIADLLPAGISLEPSSTGKETAAQMTRAFRLNLQALSLLALVCGAFLIYNTMTFAVVQRRQLLAVLRAIGTTRGQILALILGEALAIGLVGTALGQIAGVILGRSLVALVTQTINDLYFVVTVRSVALDTATLVKGFAIGLGTTILAATAPALEATRAAPRMALARIELETNTVRRVPIVSASALLLLGTGYLLLVLSGKQLVPAFAGLFLVLLGAAALTPLFILVLMAVLTPLAGTILGQTGRLATRGVAATMSRTGVAVAALMMALAVTVGVDLMIQSFRDTVDRWLTYSLPADFYVSDFASPSRRFSGGHSFDTKLVDQARALSDVEAISTLRHFQVAMDDELVRAVAIDIATEGRSGFSFKSGSEAEIWSALDSGDSVIVSESLAFKYDLSPGSSVSLGSPAGSRLFAVSGIFYDYSTEQGLLMISGDIYRNLWLDNTVTAFSVIAREGSDLEVLRTRLQSLLGTETTAQVVSNGELRQQSMKVFDRTFRITDVLKILAVIVAFVGVLSALLALQLERTRELGVLRAQGLTPVQLWRLISQQTGLIGLSAGLMAIPVGVVIATIMVKIINRRSFGWTLELQIAPSTLLQALVIGVVAALLAGLYPAWRMSNTSPADALRIE